MSLSLLQFVLSVINLIASFKVVGHIFHLMAQLLALISVKRFTDIKIKCKIAQIKLDRWQSTLYNYK